MTTAGDLVDLVSEELHGWGATQDRVTALTNSITDTDITLTVNDVFGQATGITPGVVEIGSELLYVTTVDQTTNVCGIAAGFGRGHLGTIPAAHASGSKVTSRPRFPRSQILKEINNVIGGVSPEIYAVVLDSSHTVTYPSNSYALAPTAVGVLDVQWQDYLGRWIKSRSYQLDTFDHNLRLGGGEPLGRPLRVIYTTDPTQFTSESDNYTVTGLPTTCLDVLTKGAAARMIIGVDISRAQASSVEQSNRSKVVPPNAGLNAGKFLLAEYMDRLRNEAQNLRKKYPPRLVRRF
jgi:hypothetical protein